MYEETIDFNDKLVLGIRFTSAFYQYIQDHEDLEIKIEGEWRRDISLIEFMANVVPSLVFTIRANTVS